MVWITFAKNRKTILDFGKSVCRTYGFSRVAGARSHVGGRVSFLLLPLGVCDEAAGVFAQLRVIF